MNLLFFCKLEGYYDLLFVGKTTLSDNACCNTELQWTDMRSGREGDQIIRYRIIIEEN